MTAECANQLKTTSADNQGKHSLTTLSRLTGYRFITSLAIFTHRTTPKQPKISCRFLLLVMASLTSFFQSPDEVHPSSGDWTSSLSQKPLTSFFKESTPSPP